MSNTTKQKLRRAADDELVLRDDEDVTFWVDTFDDSGAYIHSGTNSDTHRVSIEQVEEGFEFVDSNKKTV